MHVLFVVHFIIRREWCFCLAELSTVLLERTTRETDFGGMWWNNTTNFSSISNRCDTFLKARNILFPPLTFLFAFLTIYIYFFVF